MCRDTWKVTWESYHLSSRRTDDCKKRLGSESQKPSMECTFSVDMGIFLGADYPTGSYWLRSIWGSLDDKPTPKAIRSALKDFQKQSQGSGEDKKVQVLDEFDYNCAKNLRL